MSGCVHHDKPVAYFMTHGTQDQVCTYPEYGVPQLDDFAMVNGCMSQTLPTPQRRRCHPASTSPDARRAIPRGACIFVGLITRPRRRSTSNTWVPQETWDFISQF